jgi:ribonuclease E
MRSKANIIGFKRRADALKSDRAHIVVGKISKFGILELSRERLSPPLLEKSHVRCTSCEGTGLIRSVESSAFMAIRDMQLYLSRNKAAKIRVSLPEDVAMYILNWQKSISRASSRSSIHKSACLLPTARWAIRSRDS